jgi:hypothetical protein
MQLREPPMLAMNEDNSPALFRGSSAVCLACKTEVGRHRIRLHIATEEMGVMLESLHSVMKKVAFANAEIDLGP